MTPRWPPLTAALVRTDLLAGVVVGLLLVPQSLANAVLAGLPPVLGLYCALLPVVVGTFAGWCPQLQTGPVAMTAIITAATLAPIAQSGTSAYIAAAALLTLLVGVMRLSLGLLKAGHLARLISHPALTGFTAASALVIAALQIPALVGRSHGLNGSPLVGAWHALSRLPEAATCSLGLGCLIALLVLRRWPRIPGAFLVVATSTVVALVTGYQGAVVGTLPAGLPAIVLPSFDPALATRLLPGAILVTLIGLAEVMAVTRVAASRTGQVPRLDRELIGQGAAALVASLTAAFPPSGSLARSALALSLGVRTYITAVTSALIVLLVLLGGTSLLAHLPHAALATLILVAVLPLADPRPLLRAWRVHPHDGLVGTLTLILTLVLAPALIEGFLIGASLGVVLFLWRLTHPRIVDCARHPDGTWRDWRSMGLDPPQALCVLRPDARICFATAAAVEAAVHQVLANRPGLRVLVLSCDGVNEIDATGCDALRGIADLLERAGTVFAISGMKRQVEEVTRRTGLQTRIGEDRIFRTTDQAVSALMERLGLGTRSEVDQGASKVGPPGVTEPLLIPEKPHPQTTEG